jgi:serine/threonine-protein kinase HipA
MRRLLKHGGSLGGARPKTTIVHEKKRYLAKFPALGDDHDVELLEKCILDLAQLCGIEVPLSLLIPLGHGHALLVSRFDREGLIGQETKKHYLSASALMNIPYESHLGSYHEFANILRRISIQPAKDLEQLFLRLVFNLFIDNTDDHVKNHGVLHVGQGQYRLSPAFDMVMQMTNLGYQELAIMPSKHHSKMSYAFEIAPLLGLSNVQAKNIIQNLQVIIPVQLIKNIQALGGSDSLVTKVKRCLGRQQQIIWGQ